MGSSAGARHPNLTGSAGPGRWPAYGIAVRRAPVVAPPPSPQTRGERSRRGEEQRRRPERPCAWRRTGSRARSPIGRWMLWPVKPAGRGRGALTSDDAIPPAFARTQGTSNRGLLVSERAHAPFVFIHRTGAAGTSRGDDVTAAVATNHGGEQRAGQDAPARAVALDPEGRRCVAMPVLVG